MKSDSFDRRNRQNSGVPGPHFRVLKLFFRPVPEILMKKIQSFFTPHFLLNVLIDVYGNAIYVKILFYKALCRDFGSCFLIDEP